METLRAAEEERDYTMDVWASFPGYEDGVCRNVMPGSKADIVLAAEAFGAIEGQVLEQQSRRPISEARVVLWNVNRNNGVQKSFYDGLSKQVRSGGGHVDSKGRFRIERVPAGHATLLVESTHYGFSQQDVAVSSGETTTTEVLLDAPGRLEVNVVYTGAMDGRRTQCEVTCRPKGSSGEGPQFSTYLKDVFSGEEPAPDGMRDAGTHVFSLEPGTCDVVVATRVPEGVNARAYRLFEAEVRSGQTTTVEAEVGGSGVVSGHVNRSETDAAVRVYLVSEPELEPDEFQAGFPTAAKLLTNGDYVHSFLKTLVLPDTDIESATVR